MNKAARGAVYTLVGLAALCAAVLGVMVWMAWAPGRSFEGTPPPLSANEASLAERIRSHVEFLARSERNLTNNPAHLRASADYIRQHIKAAGLEPRTQSYRVNAASADNVYASIGTAAEGTPVIVVGAHYDSFIGTPGANDNASGTALLIEIMRLLKDRKLPVEVMLAFFVNEEPPYFQTEMMGSYQFAKMLDDKDVRVNAMYSLETLGYFSNAEGSQKYPFPVGLMYPSKGDFVAFVATTNARRLMQQSIRAFRETAKVPSVGGVAPAFVEGIDWSDHWAFEEYDYPAIMITDTAPFRYPYYHRPQDTPEKLDYEKLARIAAGVADMVEKRASSASAPRK